MLEVNNLCKEYETFAIKNISFHLPSGYIMGFIGANGAGKSTTLKSILHIVRPSGGKIFFEQSDMDEKELEIKQKIGFTLGAFDYYPAAKLKRIINAYKAFYPQWDDGLCNLYLKRFGLNEHKKVSELSAGMKVKFALTLALSHHATLFIFDEPTSGLDPVARDELLDLFQSIVEDGDKSILFSTHITSDLDKCADYILFIRNGEIIASDTKDDLIADHKLISGKSQDCTDDLKRRMIAYKEHSFGFKGLIRTDKLRSEDMVQSEVPNLEDIMVYYNREDQQI